MPKDRDIIIKIAIDGKGPSEPQEKAPTFRERIEYALGLVEGRSPPNPKALRLLQRAIKCPRLEKCPDLHERVKDVLELI